MSNLFMTVTLSNTIKPKLKSMRDKLNKLPEEAYKVFVKETPVRSGNARRSTKLKNKKEIQANYPYAQRLDEGWSKQSPDGMVKPTQEFIVNRFKKIMSGK